MEIKKINGEIIFKADKGNVKELVEEAVKCGADLRSADLGGAYLSGADLRSADLSGAYLRSADLSGAYLRSADLSFADLSFADLSDADLSGAYLRSADLRSADLSGAYLRSAYLRSAYLRSAKNLQHIPLSCPSDGAFIAWKKVDGKLIELEIPADARRSSSTTAKCRCDKAKVISITDIDSHDSIDEITNTNFVETLYKVGEMVYPDAFDDNRFNECSNGIHFFIDKQTAIKY